MYVDVCTCKCIYVDVKNIYDCHETRQKVSYFIIAVIIVTFVGNKTDFQILRFYLWFLLLFVCILLLYIIYNIYICIVYYMSTSFKLRTA